MDQDEIRPGEDLVEKCRLPLLAPPYLILEMYGSISTTLRRAVAGGGTPLMRTCPFGGAMDVLMRCQSSDWVRVIA